MMDLTG